MIIVFVVMAQFMFCLKLYYTSITVGISDHSAILEKKHMQRTPMQKNVIRSRNIAAIKLPLFCDDLVDVEVTNPNCLNNSLYAQVERYSSVLSHPLEKHEPIKERCVKLRPHYPWFNENILT